MNYTIHSVFWRYFTPCFGAVLLRVLALFYSVFWQKKERCKCEEFSYFFLAFNSIVLILSLYKLCPFIFTTSSDASEFSSQRRHM